MPRPTQSKPGVRDALPAAINALEVTREVARVLKAGEDGGELKNFYTYLIAYSRLIQDHLARFPGARTDTASDHLLSRIREHLESGLCFGSSGHGQECCDFRSFCLLWNTVRKLDDSRPKIQVIRACFTGQPSPEQRGTVMQCLEQFEDELRTLYPEDSSSSSWTRDDDLLVHNKVQEPSYGVCRAAQSVFKALTACVDCTCPINHNFGARLSLGTYRKLEEVSTGQGETDPGGRQLDFDMFLCMQHDWHEVCIHTPKETVVQWALEGDSASASAPAEKKPKPPAKPVKTQRVKNLCEPIAKISTMVARRLELRVTRGKLFKLRSEISTCLIDKTKEPVSLEHLLQGASRSFTERTRRILAVLLSSAVLHLHDTPWLQDTWSSSHVLFFRTTSSAVPLRPFVQAPLSRIRMGETHGPHDDGDDDEGNVDVDPDDTDPDDDLDPDDMDPDDLDPDDFMPHQCPILVMLAVMLLEVYFAVPFRILAKRYDVELSPDHYSESSRSARCLDTELVFRACRSEIPENSQFHRAVEACLDPALWEDETGRRLEDQVLRERMYVEVVLPLETELSQAYSSIALDDLDRFAQGLDLAGWDRTIVTEGEGGDLASARSSLPDLRMTVSAPSLDPRMTCSTSPSALSAYRPPLQPIPTLGGPWTSPSPPSRHAYPPPFSNIAAPVVLPRRASPAGMESEYKASRFFDDEMTSDSSGAEYRDWKSRYSDVYEKFIDSEPRASAVRPVRIAVLDTGIDLTHPDMEARLDNIKDKVNWTNERFKSLVHDRNGHGTFTAGLILDYMPHAELYIAKIADNKPSSPTMIADAINHAVTTWQVDIISMSFGFPSRAVDGYAALESAILNAYRHHVLLFAAASNSGGRLGRAFPARDPNVIAVHAADTFGNRSGFSPTASAESVNLATVGEGVESAWPVHLCDEEEDPTLVKVKSGTSYATPILAGIAGFLLFYARLHLPGETAAAESLRKRDKMEKLLKSVARKGSGYEPRDGYHFVDLSLYADSLFGKTKDMINAAIYDVLNE